ncbi:MAG: hypothetical protein DRP84_08870 [Spirochaetes bacterium]|nr:MAG: hypothetical protein DRP84_08870 [Spirochaetota bacterium]
MKNILLIARDPGATQLLILFAQFLEQNSVHFRFIARGPAETLLKKHRIDFKPFPTTTFARIRQEILDFQPSFVITGTSLKDRLEVKFIREAKKLGIQVLSVIDWWTSFKERFQLNGKLVLPDYVVVIDEYSADICEKLFNGRVKIIIGGHPYLCRLKERRIVSASREELMKKYDLVPLWRTILFLAEPLDGYVRFDQFKIFNHICKEIGNVCKKYKKNFNLIIKFHPNGEKELIYRRYKKISDFLRNYCRIVFVKKEYNVQELISISDYIWGMNTTPLLEALLMGKQVSSFLHNGIDFEGIPFMKSAGFCQSCNYFYEYRNTIENLLTDENFVRKVLKRQKRYRLPKDKFCEKLFDKIIREGIYG